eukprot:1159274-Pelagomonas_calceolata.AAC.2
MFCILHATTFSCQHLDQGSPKIQGIEDSARLNRRCLPGSLRRRKWSRDQALVAVRWSLKCSNPG